MIRSLKAIIIMSRPHNLAISIIGVSIGVFISTQYVDLDLVYWILYISVPVILVASAGYISNDIFDLESDKVSKPWRPLVRGDVSIGLALAVTILFIIVSIIYAIYAIGIYTYLFVALNSILVLSYNSYLKRYGIIGNIVISISSGNTIIYGSLAIAEIKGYDFSTIYIALIPAFFAILLSLIREILKGIEDIEGDKMIDAKTLALTLGIKKTLIITIFLGVMLWILTIIPIYIRFNIGYLILSQITIALALASSILIFRDLNNKNNIIESARKARSLTKASLFTGVLAFLLWAGT